jgi:isoleucyl-tRNA synthetase
LDILKDRLYTSGENSPARRAAQSTLHHITHTFMRLIAPILSFTADEIWQTLQLSEDKSVFEDVWYNIPAHGLSDSDLLKWEEIFQFKSFINKQIEVRRAEKELGSSLEAEIDIYCNGANYDALLLLGDDLKFVMITSRATLHKGEVEEVKVRASIHEKCGRCWHYRADVGSHASHPTICERCVSNLFGAGEARKYA